MTGVVKLAELANEFYTDVDGFVYWEPSKVLAGGLNAPQLRALANELDRRNAEWQKTIEDYFNGKLEDEPPVSGLDKTQF